MVNDVDKAKRFYGAVFGWHFTDSPGYTFIDTGEVPRGGMMPKPPAAPSAALNTYFRVDDITKTLRDVVEAGGKVIVPTMEIPGVGSFAIFVDPDNIPIGVLQLRR
jgi:predicted enzyme related to lactoylglutathione lyase